MASLEKKYEFVNKMLDAQIDVISEMTYYDEKVVAYHAKRTRELLADWINASPENREACEEVGNEHIATAQAEIADALNAKLETDEGETKNV